MAQPPHSLILESLFGEAIVNSDVAAFLIRDEAIIAANPAATRLTGYTQDELLAVSVSGLAAERAPAEEREARREAAERGELQFGSSKIRRKDGETRSVRYLAGRTVVGRTPAFLGLAWEAPPAAADAEASQGADWMRHLGVGPPAGSESEPRGRQAEPREGATDEPRARRRFRPLLRRRPVAPV